MTPTPKGIEELKLEAYKTVDDLLTSMEPNQPNV